jgi:hypothetical protein
LAPDLGSGAFEKESAGSRGTPAEIKSPIHFHYGPQDVSADSGSSEMSIELGDHPIVFSTDLGAGAGDWPTRVYYKIADADGKTVDREYLTFESGVADSHVIDTYQRVKELFLELRLEAAGKIVRP